MASLWSMSMAGFATILTLTLSIYLLFCKPAKPNGNLPKIPKRIPATLLGLKVLYPAPGEQSAGGDCDVDILAVHGLGAHPATTWTAKKAPSPQVDKGTGAAPDGYVNWLNDPGMLPAVVPRARIMVFNHESQWYGEDAISIRLEPLATSLITSVVEARKDCTSRPLIIIGHCLGGLIIEKALIHFKASRDIIPAVTAVLLLGTPHAGTEHIGFPEILQRIISSGTHVELGLLNSLRPENEGVLDAVNQFAELANNVGISIDCFFETKRSTISKMFTGDTEKAVIVDEKSASLRSWPCHPLALDHCTLNKFSDPEDGNWKVVRRVIHERYGEAVGKIRSRLRVLEPSPACLVPYDRDPRFVGRAEILDVIESLHESGSRVALHGIGGVGKSQIAIEYSYRFHERNRHSWIFWVFAGSAQRFEQAYREIAKALNLPGFDDPKVDTSALVRDWLNEETSQTPWLLILDNLDDVSVFYDIQKPSNVRASRPHQRSASSGQSVVPAEPSLKDYLPRSGRGKVLVTSRVKTAAYKIVGEHERIVSIPSLSEGEALQLLQTKVPYPLADSEQDFAARLVAELDWLPLAITQASAYMGNNEQISIAQYLDLFAERENQIELLANDESGDIRRDASVPSSVAGTWLISLEQLELKEGRTGKEAIELLYLMCYYDRRGVPVRLLCENRNSLAFQAAIGKLANYCLIVVEKGKLSYGLHRLTQLVAQSRTELEGKSSHWKAQALRMLERKFPSGETSTWKSCEELLPHFHAVRDYKMALDTSEEARALLLLKKSHYDETRGMYESMRLELTEGISILSNMPSYGPKHLASLQAKHKLGWANHSLGNNEAAEHITAEVLKDRQQLLGDDNAATLETLNNLGVITEDIDISMAALAGRRKIFGAHIATVESLHNCSLLHSFDDQPEKALHFNEAAIAMLDSLPDSTRPDLLEIRSLRSRILCDLGRYEEAERSAVDVLRLRRDTLGATHIDTIRSLEDCAQICNMMEDYAGAELYSIQCFEGYESHPELGSDHAGLVTTFSLLGSVQQLQRKLAQAEASYENALRIASKNFGSDDDETWYCRFDLSSFLVSIGETERAMGVLKSLMLLAKTQTIVNEVLLDGLSRLAKELQAEKLWDEAETLWEVTAMGNAQCESRGRDHANTVRAVNILGLLLLQRKKYSRAEELFRAEYQSRLTTWGPVHENTLFACRCLADSLRQQGRPGEAETLLRDEAALTSTSELEIIKQGQLHSLAMIFCKAEMLQLAEAIALEVVAARSSTAGDSHPETIESKDLLSKIQAKLNE